MLEVVSGIGAEDILIEGTRNTGQLMADGKNNYKIVAELEIEEQAREYEVELIQKYKKLGQAKFNKHHY
ncbi:hypothetical protein [Radiobacillus deserti]|uniref:hypothetical protein n=1 Tax=Radiobacillus deserti TaxID=2594883 RepID=UPI001E32D8CD|nr:hypothetical protein [Radiobacillus deserti]